MKAIFLSILFLFSIRAVGAQEKICLQYSTLLAKQGFASPIVKISVNGESGQFLVDSGASITVISKWFAEKARIITSGNANVGGSSGGSNKSSIGKVDFVVKSNKGMISFKDQHAVIASLPDVFKKNDLVGILSPQQLLNNHEIGVLDLSEPPSLRIYNDPPKLSGPSFDLNIVSTNGPGGTKTTLFTIDAIIANTKTSFIVDTGADGAGIGIKTLVGKKLLPHSISTGEKVGGINGDPEEVRVIPRAAIKLLDRNFEMKIRLQPISESMPADGMLGMQFLKNCQLILSQVQGSIICQ